MAKEKNGPKSLIPSDRSKTPKIEYHENWQEMRPSWRIGLLEMVEPFGWHKASASESFQVKERLANFESMTWKQILIQGSYRNHSIRKDRLCPEAQQRLEDLGQDDIDAVMSLAVTQKGRIFGIMEHNVLKIIWWNPNHLVCPAPLKNT